MSKVAQLMLLSMVGLMSGSGEQPTQIQSYKVKQKRVEEQPSKRALQRMKGKGARKNRGKNRNKNLCIQT